MTAKKLTFDQRLRLLELDDLRKVRALTPDQRAEYSALVVAWRSWNGFKDGVTPCGSCGAEWQLGTDEIEGSFFLQHKFDCTYMIQMEKEAAAAAARDQAKVDH